MQSISLYYYYYLDLMISSTTIKEYYMS